MVLKRNSDKVYNLQYRIFKDCSYYQRWIKGFIPVWGEWHDYKGLNTLEVVSDLKIKADIRKTKLKYKIEFRIIKKD